MRLGRLGRLGRLTIIKILFTFINMTTLMSCVRKDNMDLFKQLLPNASAKHIDHSLMIVVRDSENNTTSDLKLTFFKHLVKHPNVTEKGIKDAFGAAAMNQQRKMLAVLLKHPLLHQHDLIEFIIFHTNN